LQGHADTEGLLGERGPRVEAEHLGFEHLLGVAQDAERVNVSLLLVEWGVRLNGASVLALGALVGVCLVDGLLVLFLHLLFHFALLELGLVEEEGLQLDED